MALQLNPDTTDDFESKTLAEMRQMVFDGLGFIAPFLASGTQNTYQDSLENMRTAILQRLGLALALLANTDTYANIATDVYNAGGFAALGTHPPGVDTLISTIINDVQRTLFARLEFDKGGVSPPSVISGSQTTILDATPIRLLAIAELKGHYEQPDAQVYFQQAEKYLSDLTQRTPPNIIGQVNAALIESHNTTFRRYEMTGLTFPVTARGYGTTSNDIFGRALSSSGNYTSTVSDTDLTQVDYHPVVMLAEANLKAKIGQTDAKALMDQYEKYMQDSMQRLPPNAATIVNQTLKMTQQQLYRKYNVFHMERWYTWSIVAGQRFYGTFDDDGAKSVAPTNLLAVAGTSGAVVSHLMTAHRYGIQPITLSTGKVLVVGGNDTAGNVQTSTDLFDPVSGIFSASGVMTVRRAEYGISTLQDGQVLVTGGFNGIGLFTAEIYDPDTGIFTEQHAMNSARWKHTQTTLLNGTVLVTGGATSGSGSTTVATAEIFDPATGLFTLVGSMATARRDHTATLLPDGRVLIAGGATNPNTSVNTAELYDPVAKTFTNASGTMSAVRRGHTATMLATGFALIAGGEDNGGGALASADLFNPSSDTFSATGAMVNGRAYGAGAILLPSGNVLVAGDNIGAAGGLAEVYNVQTGAFASTSTPMSTNVSFTIPALLADGRVLIAGGIDNFGNAVDTAMFYDYHANSFSPTGNINQGSVFYEVTAFTANGESLPGPEVFVLTVPANTAINLSWTPTPKQPFVLGFNIYRGKTTGNEGFIASVPASQTTYIDQGTIPQGAAPPTENNTAGPGRLDPRHLTWVGLSFNDNVWNPLIRGIPPMAFAQNINGVPTNYEIRQSLEIWPAPTTTDWKIQIKGYFQPTVFESDDDETTIDWQALYFQTIANAMPRFKRPNGQAWFNQLEIAQAQAESTEYIKRLVAGTHMTGRYVPGAILQRNAVRPVLSGPYIGYP